MAKIGRFVGGVITVGTSIPETFAAPADIFPTAQRNDGSIYGFTPATSTLTLPSTALADGYLLVAYFEFQDTTNGRFNPQGRIIQASGTGNFVGGPTGGYLRDTSEDRAYVRCWAFIDNPSASATFQFQWRSDVDDAIGSTEGSAFEVIPFFYADIGMYASVDSSLLGGTTPNVVSGWVTTLEGTNITRTADVITVTGDNKRYLMFASQFFEGRAGRTQRWHGLDIDGSQESAAQAYSYYRDASNDENGDLFTHFLETVTASITIEQTCYRGDGVANGDGGADIDGSTPGTSDHTLVVIELNDSAECFHSVDGTGNQNWAAAGPIDIPVTRVGDITFSDAASWVRATDDGMNAEVTMDALLGANASGASNVVGTTTRWTAFANFTVNGVEDIDTRSGDYQRNNQSTQDTFGWSANLLSFVELSKNEDIGLSVTELVGTEGGGGNVRANAGWVGFWGVNLDTLEAAPSGVRRLDVAAGESTNAFPYTVSPGTNRALIVGVTQEGAGVGQLTVGYGGQTMTHIVGINVGDATDQRVDLYWLDDAGIAAAADNQIDLTSPPTTFTIHAASYFGASQSAPTTVDSEAQTGAGSPLTNITIASVDGATVCSVQGMGNDGTETWGGTIPCTERTGVNVGATARGSFADRLSDATETVNCECTFVTPNRSAGCALLLEEPSAVGIVPKLSLMGVGS